MPRDKTPKPRQVASFRNNNTIVETIFVDGVPKYAIKNGKPSSDVEISAYFKPTTDEHVVPVSDKAGLARERIVVYPPAPVAYGKHEDLVAEIKNFINTYWDCPGEWEDLLTHYTLMSWVYDRFSAVPYFRILGDFGTGKTRGLTVAHRLSYKGAMTMGVSSIASVYRMLELYRGTIVLDETDYDKSDMRSDVIKILNSGYNKNGHVMRCNPPSYDPIPYKTFGPKILANRTRFQDSAIESRCLTFEDHDRELRSEIPLQLPDCFEDEAEVIRGKLLQWRLDNVNSVKLRLMPGLGLDSRGMEVGSTIWAVSKDPKFDEWFLEFLAGRAMSQAADNPKVEIARAIVRLAKVNSVVYVNDVAADYNMDLPVADHLSPRAIGGYIRALGFVPVRWAKGYRFLVYIDDSRKLTAKYGED